MREGVDSPRAVGGEARKPLLRPSDVPGSPDVLYVTLMDVSLLKRGNLARLEFREYPGHILWAEGRDLAALCEQTGTSEVARMRGELVRLDKVARTNTYTRELVVKYVVGAAGDDPPARVAEFAPPPPREAPAEVVRRVRRRR